MECGALAPLSFWRLGANAGGTGGVSGANDCKASRSSAQSARSFKNFFAIFAFFAAQNSLGDWNSRDPAGRSGFPRSEDFWILPLFFGGLTSAIQNDDWLRKRAFSGSVVVCAGRMPANRAEPCACGKTKKRELSLSHSEKMERPSSFV